MKITENIFMAVKNLRNNKARSFLTMLGIIIGVGAVITMVSLGEGAKQQITQQIAQIGSNLIMVTPGRNGNNAITNDTVDLLRDSVEHVRAVAPVVRGAVVAETQENSIDTALIGCTPEYAAVRNYQVAFGQFIGVDEYKDRRKVAVIGAELATELYPGINPIGETIKVDGVRLEIIGVLAEKGQGGFGNADNVVMLPLTTAQDRIFGNRNIG
ncbi:MAG TPA: ABC transporter permease, partial [Bacillota bacterium]|nr:ABC transporter permease [Bacillota bacterium]